MSRFPYIDQWWTIGDEVIITYNPILEDFQGKKILIVGGGPTTNECEWNDKDYDYIFSCNHFFLHPRLTNVNFATISPEVNVKSEKFLNYFDNSNCLFCFDNKDSKDSDIRWLYNRDPNRVVISLTRKLWKIGATSVLMILTSSFQPREMHVIGMDGAPPHLKGLGFDTKHSFQPGKTSQSIHYSYDKYVKWYGEFWDYLINDIGKDIKYKNLGHGHPYNISTKFNII